MVSYGRYCGAGPRGGGLWRTGGADDPQGEHRPPGGRGDPCKAYFGPAKHFFILNNIKIYYGENYVCNCSFI